MRHYLNFLTTFFVFLFIFIFSASSYSRSWIYNIGGMSNDVAYSLLTDLDMDSIPINYAIIGGETSSWGFGGNDACIMKYRINTTFPFITYQWAHVIGNSLDDAGFCLTREFSGPLTNYILCGHAQNQMPLNEDLFLAKYSNAGALRCMKSFDVNGSKQDDEARKIIVDFGGNYVITGNTFATDSSSDILIAKFNSSCNPIWAYTAGLPGVRDVGRSIIQDPWGDYIILGYTNNGNMRDIVLTKIAPTGAVLASRRIAGIREDYGWDLAVDLNDSNYVVTGWTRSFGATFKADLLLFKINRPLTGILWSKVLTHTDTTVLGSEAGLDIGLAADGNFLVTGFTENYNNVNSDPEALYAEFDHSGNWVWAKIIPDVEMPNPDEIHSFVPPHVFYSNYLAAGFTQSNTFGTSGSDILLTSLNETSDICYQNIQPLVFDLQLSLDSFPQPEQVNLDSTFFLKDSLFVPYQKRICADDTGWTSIQSSQNQNSTANTSGIKFRIGGNSGISQNFYYNLPTQTSIVLRIYNVRGQLVKTVLQRTQGPGSYRVTWDGKSQVNLPVASGIYFYQFIAGQNFVKYGRFAIIK